MKLTLDNFKGIAPKTAPSLLPGIRAQTAQNVRLSSGILKPWYNCSKDDDLVNTGTVRTIFLYEDNYWLEWEADVDVVLGPVSGDTAAKFYYTGHGIPKKSNKTEATTGAGAMPINFYPMGMPIPKAALSANPTGSGGTGDDRDINYVWSVVSSWGEEGPPSPAMSSTVQAKNGETVDLSGITMEWKASTSYAVGNWVFEVGDEGGTYVYKCVTAGTSGASEPTWNQTVDGDTTDNTVTWRCYKSHLSLKYIYRYNTGEQYGSYEYVDSIDISDTTYSDSKTDSELGESLSSESYDPPPDAMEGLVYLGNGILAGFTGKDVYFSVAYKPWAWPAEYAISLPGPIVGQAVTGNTLRIKERYCEQGQRGCFPRSGWALRPEPGANEEPDRGIL